jgi:hypothetical protein
LSYLLRNVVAATGLDLDLDLHVENSKVDRLSWSSLALILTCQPSRSVVGSGSSDLVTQWHFRSLQINGGLSSSRPASSRPVLSVLSFGLAWLQSVGASQAINQSQSFRPP